ncbi:helix-turn-helix domain-containing protein [Candidatus Sumerlaeota bacterium]|nr:helix-turn-helix domain-containing protein [Candidatus Sumerlaeota bacterium]
MRKKQKQVKVEKQAKEEKQEKKVDYVTVEELAKNLKVSMRTIQRIIHRKQLPAIRIGRQWRFRKEWVDEWLKNNTINLELEDMG